MPAVASPNTKLDACCTAKEFRERIKEYTDEKAQKLKDLEDRKAVSQSTKSRSAGMNVEVNS